MVIYTIGFTKTTAESFFGRLAGAHVKRVLDVRLNNTSQLAGFAKAQDLPFFLRELIGAEYQHAPQLAPTQEIIDGYRKHKRGFDWFARQYLALIESRQIEQLLSPADFATPTALLCAEPDAHECHRSLAVDHLARLWPGVEAVHL